MTAFAWLALTLTLAVAVIDWFAVDRELERTEAFAKPLTLVFLIVAVLGLDAADPAQRTAWLVALAFCLAGDVFLFVAHRRDEFFVPGLVAFLLGHVAYVVGFWIRGVEPVGLAVGAFVVVVGVATIGRTIVAAARDREPALATPVLAYLVVISTMVVSAFGTVGLLAALGAVLFYASDATIAWTRFVRDLPHGRAVIMVTYHLGQVLLALSLV